MVYDVQNGQQVPMNPCRVGAALCQKWEAPHIKQFRWHSDLCDAVPQVISNIYRNCKYCTFTVTSTLIYLVILFNLIVPTLLSLVGGPLSGNGCGSPNKYVCYFFITCYFINSVYS